MYDPEVTQRDLRDLRYDYERALEDLNRRLTREIRGLTEEMRQTRAELFQALAKHEKAHQDDK